MPADRKKNKETPILYTIKKSEGAKPSIKKKCSPTHKNSAIHILRSFVSGIHILADDELRK